MFVKNFVLRGARALGFIPKANTAKKVISPVQIASSGAKTAVNNVGEKLSKSDLMAILNDYDRGNPHSFVNAFNSYMY